MMLSDDVNDFDAVVTALRAWYQNGRPAAGYPQGIAEYQNDVNTLHIPYGAWEAQNGMIRMKRDNFKVTHATEPPGGQFAAFASYNHHWDAGPFDQNDIWAALAEPRLSNNAKSRMIVICLTAESARSMVVARIMRGVLGGGVMDQDDYGLLQELTKSYDHTTQMANRPILPGNGWSPLTQQEHLNYLGDPGRGNVVRYDNALTATCQKFP
jgi:hypothetical protein